MIIGSCGYGATGSSILTDLLSEYEETQIFDNFEFVFPYIADGIEDLEYHLMNHYAKGESCDIAIKRFLKRAKCYNTPFINRPCNGKKFYQLAKDFVKNITQFRFKGVYTADMYTGYYFRDIFAFASKKIFMPKIIDKIARKRTYFWPCHNIYYSIEPDNFYVEARKFTKEILINMGANLEKNVILDQPFPGNDPLQSMNYFDDSYAIVVDRDPRDLYLASKYSKDPNFKFSPIGNVDDFIKYYRSLRTKKISNDRVLYINMEELIYDYDNSIERIELFLSLNGKHKKKKEVFNPARSINNTQLIRLHPEDKEDIIKIEKELGDFLFDFNRFPNVEFNGKPFDGAERKMYTQ